MLNLLFKDFKLMFKQEKRLSTRIISGLFTLLFVGSFVAIEVFLFNTIINKISNFSGATEAFLSLFLFIISLLLIISAVVNARKLFFNEKDIEQLSVHPVSNAAVICSKLIFLFVTHYVTSLIFVFPIFLAYGLHSGKTISFYYLGLFYPILSFLFEMGVGLILVYPSWLLKKYLEKHLIVQYVTSLVILFVGCFLYAQVLNLFIEMVAGNNVLSLFTTTSINKLIELEKFEIPINFLIEAFVLRNTTSLVPFLLIAFGIFVLGATITIFAYNYVRNISMTSAKKEMTEKEFKPMSVIKTLIRKEVIVLTKNADYTTTYTGLLIVQPFLAFLVIKALNSIFSTGVFAYYITVVPNFIPLMDILLLMLFTVIIGQGANNYIQMEKSTIKVMKTIPVKYTIQLGVKVMIPFVLSMSSLLITLLVLLCGKLIDFQTFICGFVLVTTLLIVFDIVSLKEELSIRNKKPRSTFLSSMLSYVLPILYFVVCAVLSYFGLDIYLAYLAGWLVFIIIGLPIALILWKKMNSLFMDLDVVN